VRSFTHEITTSGSYSWSNLKPGSYLYMSGTHPAVQVQMGLYGALTHDAAPGVAYAGLPYDNAVTLLYSEIDPALHSAVSGGTYGTPSYPSTINYHPRYTLVNGMPHVAGDLPLPAGTAGGRTLLRLLNAGLEGHSLVLQGQHMRMVAEDGNPYPFAREQYSAFLAAGKSKDAIFIPAANGEYAIADRRLRPGMMSTLAVSAATPGPTANADLATVDEDSTATVIAVLGNDLATLNPIDTTSVAITAPALNGLAVANGDGTTSYTPNANFNGADSFSYTVRDSLGNPSSAAAVAVTVNGINDTPVALGDTFTALQDSAGNTLDVLANDSDIDGDPLTITAVGATDNGGSTTINGSTISYTPVAGFAGVEGFSYDIADGNGGVASATVSVTVTAAVKQAPVANDDYGTVTFNTGNAGTNSVTITVVANDTDDGAIAPATVTITSAPRKGAVLNNGDGTVTYTPAGGKRGADAFGYTVNDDLGLSSNEATVRIDIVK
jgi:hypothetical protein